MRIQSIKTARNLHTVSILELKIFFGRIQIKEDGNIFDGLTSQNYYIMRVKVDIQDSYSVRIQDGVIRSTWTASTTSSTLLFLPLAWIAGIS